MVADFANSSIAKLCLKPRCDANNYRLTIAFADDKAYNERNNRIVNHMTVSERVRCCEELPTQMIEPTISIESVWVSLLIGKGGQSKD